MLEKSNIELAFLDDLTGIYNRRYLYKFLSEQLPRSRKLALFMMDLDGFKKINDNFGHLEGDAILVSFSKAINASVGDNGIVMRYAGDEFIVVLPEKEKNEAVSLAAKLVGDVSRQPLAGKEGAKGHAITTSLGLAIYPDDASNPEDLIDKADQALYSSKRSGKNRFMAADQITHDVAAMSKSMKDFFMPEFVDRKKEFLSLKEALASVTEKITAAVLIAGSKGIGKTRILNEFINFSSSYGAKYIKLKCSEENMSMPYGVLLDGLNSYLKSDKNNAIEILSKLSREELSQIISVLPSLEEYCADVPLAKESDDNKKRLNLFSGIAKLFELIIPSGILVLAIDDIHWLDTASLSMINFLIKAKKTRLLFFATYLSETGPALPFGKFLSSEGNKALFQAITLGPLEKNDVKDLLLSILRGIELTGEFLDMIYRRTEGNPFFLQESLRLLIDKGKISFREGKWNLGEVSIDDFPLSFEEAGKSWLNSLDQETREILTNAAFVGDDFNIELLKKVTQKNEGQILDIIDKANKSGLIQTKSALNADEFNFSNRQLKDILQGLADSTKARDLHEKIAQALESYYKGDFSRMAGNALLHYKGAGVQKKILEYTKKISDIENQLFSFEEAATYIEKLPEKEVMASVEEILEKPLSEESKKILPDAIISLRSAIESTFLYPPNNLQRINFQDEAFNKIVNILEPEKSITFSIVDKALLINGEELEKKELRNTLAAAFAAFLSNYRINSMTFKQGITKSEFSFFLDSITRTEDYLNKMGGLAKLLKDNNVVFIKIDQVRYEKAHKISAKFKETKNVLKSLILQYPLLSEIAAKGEDVFKAKPKEFLKEAMNSYLGAIEEISRSSGQVGEKADTILESLKKIAEPLSKADPQQWEQEKQALSEKFFALDPALRAEVIKKDFYNIDAPGAVLNDIINNSSDKNIIDTVCQNLESKNVPLEDISDMLKVIFANPKRKNKLTPVLEDKLLKMGISSKDISSILNKEPPAEEAKMSDALEQTVRNAAAENLPKDAAGDFRSIIDGLILKGRDDAIEAIAAQILQETFNSAEELRKAGMQNFSIIMDVLFARERYATLDKIMLLGMQALDKENDLKNYAFFADIIVKPVRGLLYKENYKKAGEFLAIIKAPAEQRSVYQQKIINDALESLIDASVFDLLVAFFNKDSEYSDENIGSFLIKLGTYAVAALLRIMETEELTKDPFDLFVRRRRVAAALKKIGKEATDVLKYKLSDQSPRVVKFSLEALGYIEDKSVCPDLKNMVDHPDYAAREELVKTLRKLWSDESMKILLLLLRDKNTRVRKRAQAVLIEMADKSVIPEIEKLASDPDIGVEIREILDHIKKKAVK